MLWLTPHPPLPSSQDELQRREPVRQQPVPGINFAFPSCFFVFFPSCFFVFMTQTNCKFHFSPFRTCATGWRRRSSSPCPGRTAKRRARVRFCGPPRSPRRCPAYLVGTLGAPTLSRLEIMSYTNPIRDKTDEELLEVCKASSPKQRGCAMAATKGADIMKCSLVKD